MSDKGASTVEGAEPLVVVNSELKVPMGLAALLVDPQQQGANTGGLEPGVHLNWALPDALLRGVVREDTSGGGQEVDFPEIPDTWLILRLSAPTAGAKRALRAWVLDSWSGTHQSLADWQASPANNRDPALRLTGLGFMDAEGEIVERAPVRGVPIGGDQAAFTAFYPYARDRFGFHDPLTDVTQGPISYLVVGWYGESARDPFVSAGSDMARLDLLEDFKWEVEGWTFEVDYDTQTPPEGTARVAGPKSLKSAAQRGQVGGILADAVGPTGTMIFVVDQPGDPGGETPGGDTPGEEPAPEPAPSTAPDYVASPQPPRRMVCHGQVVDIPWGGAGGTLQPQGYSPIPKPGKARFSVGDTPIDALGSLLVASTSWDLRWVLDLLQGRGVKSLQSLDGVAAIQAELHQQGFYSHGTLDAAGALKVLEELPAWAALVAQLEADPDFPRPPPPTAGSGGGGGVVVDPGDLVEESAELEVAETGRVRAPSLSAATRASGRREALSPGSLGAQTLGATLKGDAEAAFEETTDVGSTQGGPSGDSASGSAPASAPAPEARYWSPTPPVVMVSGAGRSFLYGHDGRFDDDDRLNCRVVSQTVRAVHLTVAQSDVYGGGAATERTTKGGAAAARTTPYASWQVDVVAADIAPMPPLTALPLSVRELADELPLLDPTSADAAAQAFAAEVGLDAQTITLDPVREAWQIETTCWWLTALAGVDKDEVQDLCDIPGVLPSPMAVVAYGSQWHTLYLDYDALVLPVEAADPGWRLGEVDRDPTPALSVEEAPISFSGRTVVSDAGPTLLADALDRMLMDEALRDALDAADPGAVARLESQADAMRTLDVLSADMKAVDDALRNAGKTVRSGLLAFEGLRLVDGFGREVALNPTDLQAEPEEWMHVAQGQVQATWSGGLQTYPSQGEYHGVALPPRLLTGARLGLRFMDAGGQDVEASPGVSPVCGYLMMDHVDGALEVFDAAGVSQGQLRPGPGGAPIWEPAPGREARQSEGAGGNIQSAQLRGLVQGVLQEGLLGVAQQRATPTPLGTLVALLDSVRNSVDRIGDTGEFLSTLMGAPIAVVRARGALQYAPTPEGIVFAEMKAVYGVQGAEDMLGVAGISAPDPVQGLSFAAPLGARLGSITQMDDGLLGYYEAGAYRRIRSPLQGDASLHRETWQPEDWTLEDLPFIEEEGLIGFAPEQGVELTLLMAPGAGVYLTSGFLPRKRIGLLRDWLKGGLGHLAPTFAFGPLLVDPGLFRMPLPGSERFDWEWTRRERPAAGEGGWSLAEPGQATDRATLSQGRVVVHEGWLRMRPKG